MFVASLPAPASPCYPTPTMRDRTHRTGRVTPTPHLDAHESRRGFSFRDVLRFDGEECPMDIEYWLAREEWVERGKALQARIATARAAGNVHREVFSPSLDALGTLVDTLAR